MNPARPLLFFLTYFIVLSEGGRLAAELRLPSIFSDGMVLQQELGAPLWGWSEPGSTVTVTFSEFTLSANADSEGYWKVIFEDLQASKIPRVVSIDSDGKVFRIEDVLVGEVWLASGQSNMAWKMRGTDSKEYALTVDNPNVRHYQGGLISTETPQSDYQGKWSSATPETTSAFSAAAFHFAERLNDELDVPVGIIETAWGGRPIQAFISDSGIRAIPAGGEAVEKKATAIESYDPERIERAFEKRRAAYVDALDEWRKSDRTEKKPRAPKKPENPKVGSLYHSNIFNGMIHPIIGYGIRGAIWYQGEANQREAWLYTDLMAGLVADWRSLWGNDFSFYWVQLAAFQKPVIEAGQSHGWVDLQNAQRIALEVIPRSGMAVTNDIGGIDIHPKNKKDVGIRLARWALNQDYSSEELANGGKGQDVIPSGPLFSDAEFLGPKVIVSFEYADGLHSRDGDELNWFELAGPDGKWVFADAIIEGQTVEVTSPLVNEAKEVRYAWAMNPEGANLVNATDLPASCFSSKKN